MNRTVEAGKTLLIDGPASVKLVSGRSSVLGAPLNKNSGIIVRRGRTIPFETAEASTFDIVLGENANTVEVVGTTIPESWINVANEIVHYNYPYSILVMGGTDSGKTTFSTFLVNAALKFGLKTALADADLGQADLGPPATIGMAVVSDFITDPFTIRARDIHFIGSTNPSALTDRVLSALAKLRTRIQATNVKFAVINTDGWIEGDGAARFKISMAQTVCSNAVVGIQRNDELEHILNPLERSGYRIIRVQTPSTIKKRDLEERKRLREQGYRKYLKSGKLRVLPMSWTGFRFTHVGSGKTLSPEKISELEHGLNCRLAYGEEGQDALSLVVDGKVGVDETRLEAWKLSLNKKVYLNIKGDERNLLVGLLNHSEEFCGLGVLHDIDFERRALRIYTPYKGRIATVAFGGVKVAKYGREIEITDVFSV